MTQDFDAPVVKRGDGEALRSLSASAISTFLTCPEKYRQSYLLGEWGKSTGAIVLGTSYHHARRKNYEQKVWSHADLSTADLLDAYAEGWDEATSHDVRWFDDDPADLKDLGARMAAMYHETVSPTVQPSATEEWFELVVSGVPVPVKGFVDVRTTDRRIIDTKTDGKGVKTPKPDWRVQSLTYFAAWPEYDFEWHVHSKSGALRIATGTTDPALLVRNTAAKRRSAHEIVRQTWDTLTHFYTRYGLENPWPGNALTHPWACKTCSYKGRCFWWL